MNNIMRKRLEDPNDESGFPIVLTGFLLLILLAVICSQRPPRQTTEFYNPANYDRPSLMDMP